MIERLIHAALAQRAAVLITTLALIVLGVWSFLRMPIDAFPDVTNVQVQVLAEAPGMAPPDIERLVAFPVELEMNGVPRVTQVRSISKFGLAVITVVFEDDVDIYFARQQVAERLTLAANDLPAGAKAALGPIATGMGEIFQYTLEGPQDLLTRRTVQDWMIRPHLRTVPGVTEVNTLGGLLKQHQVEVRPDRLAAYGLTVQDVIEALGRANRNAPGNYFERGDEQLLVRGVGLLEGPGALPGVLVAVHHGRPIFLSDLAAVGVGAAPRQGAATRDGAETVAGIVMKLRGENGREVVQRVKDKLAELAPTLPPGMTIKPFYDQSELVEQAVGTVERSLIEGGVLVVGVLVFFLWHVPSSLIVAVTIPLAMLFAFVMMRLFGLPGNLMSLGGLAIGLGMMVDASIVMVENLYRHLGENHGKEPVLTVVARSAYEVGRPIVFAITIIIAVFLPLFTLGGLEGKMFSPMAFTISFALLGSLLLALTLVPVLASLVLQRDLVERENPALVALKALYTRSLARALRRGPLLVGAAVVGLGAALALVPRLGTEFLPSMDEGSSVITASRLPSVSLAKANAQANMVEQALRRVPEVRSVTTRTGRAEVASDPMDVAQSDMFIQLKPHAAWMTARDKAGLVAAMERATAHIPGIGLSFGEPIAVRVDELISGVKSQVAVKLFGEDLEVLARKGAAIQATLGRVAGASDVKMEQLTGLAQLQITYDRPRMAHYGLTPADLGTIVGAAIGGEVATELLEGQRRVGVAVRLPAEARNDPARLAAIPVPLAGGGRVPLGHIARIGVTQGPAVISRENGQRRVVVECNVTGRDIGSFVADARAAIAREVSLPSGYLLTWGGQFENQQRAMGTLSIVVPLVLGGIYLLLFMTFGSLSRAGVVLLNVPFALIGGIAALFVSGQHLSVSASVGFIALFGVAVQNGVILLTTIDALRATGLPMAEAITKGAAQRLRPVLMTALVASLGLVPLALSSGIGSEIQRPLAWVVIGGLFTSTALTLYLLPVAYGWWCRAPLGTEPEALAAATAPGG
ncbi:MAG: CusA/CzcA family heavy metal efflux RND transporter [Candidatus Sericytochromatia bacterium]|nr:CusA/CzcA family heavy metal efflux RND transporter [Candidatus Sericytochromatia bacterium]